MKTRWIAVSLIASFVSLGGAAAAKPDAERRSPALEGASRKPAAPESRKPAANKGEKPEGRPPALRAPKRENDAAETSRKEKDRKHDGSKVKQRQGKDGAERAPGLERASENRRRAAEAIHERRMAKLQKARAIAKRKGREDLLLRVDRLVAKENARHARHMSRLDSAKKKGRS